MGLFDKKYKEKDYIISTADFKDRLDELYRNASQMEGCGRLVTGLLMKLDEYKSYPKGRNVDQALVKEVDDRIDRLITSLKQDAQDKNGPRFTQHAEILFRAIEDSRQYGKEKYDKRYLENEETMATAMGEIYNALNQRSAIEKQKADLLAEAKKLSPAQKGELQKIELQYNTLEARDKQLSGTVNMWQSRYNAAIKVESEYATGRQIQSLTQAQIVKPAEFQAVVSKNQQMLEKEMGMDTEINEIFDEAQSEREGMYNANATTSSFMGDLEASKIMDAQNAVNGASVSAPQEETSAFFSALNNL